MVSQIQRTLGCSERYAYRAQPVSLYVKNHDGIMVKVKYYIVDFEIACDLKNINDARSDYFVSNPHLINIREPDGQGDYVSHCTMIDEKTYDVLRSFTNSDGRLRRYTGVVNGYAVRSFYGDFDYMRPDTGLFLSDVDIGLLQYPEQPFDEKKHMRFVQASESYRLKLFKRKRVKRSVH